jgi:Fe-S cluster assembly protein SufB
MTHIGKDTRSRIISKGISAGKSKNSYRGAVNVTSKALGQEIILNVILY